MPITRKNQVSSVDSDGYLSAIIEGNKREATEVTASYLLSGKTYTKVCGDIIHPAMYDVGDLWQSNKISVAQEHLASSITQSVLSNCFAKADFKSPNSQTAVFACVEKNFHGIGLRMISDAFEIEGWDSHFLGVDTPTQALLECINNMQPAVVGVSVSMPEHIASLKTITHSIVAHYGSSRPRIIVGGNILNRVGSLPEKYGIDAVINNVKHCI